MNQACHSLLHHDRVDDFSRLQSRPKPSSTKKKPSYAFITNGVADFWEHARAGANDGRKRIQRRCHRHHCRARSPTRPARSKILLTRGTNGIAISPIDPA